MPGHYIVIFLSIIILCNNVDADDRYKLKQVLVLSRHSVRTPLTANLERTTPKKWPTWSAKLGHLTPKGVLLEGFMGEYFAAWLKNEKLLSDKCPSQDVAFIYANTRQRTKESAKAFAEAAFKNCNTNIHFKDTEEMDPVFNPVIRNTTEEFKEIVLKDMQMRLDELKLNEAYATLEKIIDFKNSEMCKTDSICDLVEEKTSLLYKTGQEPNVLGPLWIGNAVVDPFLMAYYDGIDMEHVAWGQINEPKQWRLLMEINKGNHNVRFNTTLLARDAAKPLIDYMTKILLNDNETPKFTLLMGHDANIYSVLTALGFKPYNLPNQYENTPIGGKIVFQKWFDEENNRNLLRVNYIYQSTEQIRNGVKLTLDNPPQIVLLEITNCDIDDNGYCLWSDFINVLKSLQLIGT